MRVQNLLILALVTIFWGCSDKPEAKGDFLIFGDYYGMCGGDGCIDYYKIENGNIYKDLLNEYPSDNINHHFNVYNGPYSMAILDLQNEIPNNIYNEENTLGMPDAYDQGGYYLEVCKNGIITNWRIDKNNQDIPNYLIAVCDSMQHYLDVLE
jgi:hypothetical protein